jgi:acyl-CoA synthetase (AMP-forming)/AMP-acid ligase II
MGFLVDRFAEAPDRVAFIDDGRRVSYGELRADRQRYAELIEGHGIRRGDVVVIVGDYSPELFAFMLALVDHGNVLAPLTRDSVIERDAVMEIAQAEWFIDFSRSPDEIRVEASGRTPTHPLIYGLRDRGAAGLLLFSSGSTGRPKGILHDWDRMVTKFEPRRRPIVAICFLMLDHFGGINTLLSITSSLGTVVTVRERSVAAICQTIQDQRVEVLPTTPSFLNMLVRSGAPERFDLSSLQLITYGTEVMPEPTLERLTRIFPKVRLQQTYGLSELGVLRSKSRGDGSLWVRIGGEGFATKVVDDILWIKSDYAMLGYLNAPVPFDADGWFCTEDRVEVDGDWIRILGRVTDLINIGGQKVYPAEIEDVILELDNIEDAAIFAEQNALLGSIIVARVTTATPEAVGHLKKRIRRACAERLSPFKVPSKVVLADAALYSGRHKKIRRPQAA